MGSQTIPNGPIGQPQDWLSFIDACQVAIGRSQLEPSSQALLPTVYEAARGLRTQAGRILGRFVIFRIASRLHKTVGPGEPLGPAYLRDDSHRGTSAGDIFGAPPTRLLTDGAGDSRVNAVLDYIEKNHLQPECRLADIARNLRMSRSHLSRLVLKQTGVTFKGHLQLARMNTAARLLQETNLSIKEIASSTGYEHVPSFDRQFRHYFQVTPGRFRRLTTGPS